MIHHWYSYGVNISFFYENLDNTLPIANGNHAQKDSHPLVIQITVIEHFSDQTFGQSTAAGIHTEVSYERFRER